MVGVGMGEGFGPRPHVESHELYVPGDFVTLVVALCEIPQNLAAAPREIPQTLAVASREIPQTLAVAPREIPQTAF